MEGRERAPGRGEAELAGSDRAPIPIPMGSNAADGHKSSTTPPNAFAANEAAAKRARPGPKRRRAADCLLQLALALAARELLLDLLAPGGSSLAARGTIEGLAAWPCEKQLCPVENLMGRRLQFVAAAAAAHESGRVGTSASGPQVAASSTTASSTRANSTAQPPANETTKSGRSEFGGPASGGGARPRENPADSARGQKQQIFPPGGQISAPRDWGAQLVAVQAPAWPRGGTNSTSVVCNSRARCVQLEFADRRPNDFENRAHLANEPRPSGAHQPDKIPSGPPETKAGPSSSPASAQIESSGLGGGGGGESDNSGDAAAANSQRSNKIALIEFARDYSFDEEHDEGQAELDEPSAQSGPGGGEPRGAQPAGRGKTGNGPGSWLEKRARTRTPDGSAGADRLPAAIKHANDQSKVVANDAASAEPTNATTTTTTTRSPTSGQSAGLTAKMAVLLSIKGEAGGPPNGTAAAGTQQERAPQEGTQAGGETGNGLSASPPTAGKSVHHFNGGGLAPAREQALAGSPGNFYSTYLGGGGGGDGPQRRRKHKQAARKPAELAAGDNHLPTVSRISPLRSLDLSWGRLRAASENSSSPEDAQNQTTTTTTTTTTGRVLVEMLKEIEARDVQALSLRANDLKFETWTQVYALLILPMRKNLYQLDVSHNSLAKLGVTFTGYIEHHLAHQLIVGHNQSWPFASALASPNTLMATGQQQQQNSTPVGSNFLSSSLSFFKLAPASQQVAAANAIGDLGHTPSQAKLAKLVEPGPATRRTQKQQQQLLRHPNLGEGKLFNWVRRELPLELSSVIPATTGSPENSEKSNSTTGHPERGTHARNKAQHQIAFYQAAKIRALDLSHNKLEWLINDQFRVLRHVESIRLDHNEIRYIHQQAFNGLEELKFLNLNQNRIQTIYMEQFQTNFNLQALFMQSNYLTYLRAGSFASLAKLKRLDLSKNKFTLLSNNAFAGLDSLEFLNLSSNQFVHVPSTSFHSIAGTLRQLDLSRNQLAQLMPGTFFHLKLEQLWLDHNHQLVTIDRGAFWDLPYLSELSLGSSRMLISINSQAFVGLPSIELINYDDCPLLEADTKQMLDNITLATTLRQLTVKQPAESSSGLGDQQQQQQLGNVTSSTTTSLLVGPSQPAEGLVAAPVRLPNTKHQQMMLQMRLSDQLDQMQEAPQVVGGGGVGVDLQQMRFQPPDDEMVWSAASLRLVYPLGCLVFIVIALKLVFSFTSMSHYVDRRRQRRRVYQTGSSISGSSAGSSTSSPPNSPGSSSSASSSSSSSSSPSGDSLSSPGQDNATAQLRNGDLNSLANLYCDDEGSLAGPNAFAMCEQQPRNAIGLKLRQPTTGELAQPSEGQLMVVGPSAGCCELDPTASNQLGLAASSEATFQQACQCSECLGVAQQCQQAAELNIQAGQAAGEAELGQADIGQQEGPLVRGTPTESNGNGQGGNCCDNATTTTSTTPQARDADESESAAAAGPPSMAGQTRPAALDLIHNQLVAAGYDYGHANCAHFYQSLGPALQLADLTANLVNQMDYYS